jgi:hypothetical protein
VKISLRLERRPIEGYLTTVLTHVKVMDEAGRYIAFAQHTPELVEFLGRLQLDAPAELLTWKGKAT